MNIQRRPLASLFLALFAFGSWGPSPLAALEPLDFPDPVPASTAVSPGTVRQGGLRQFKQSSNDEASAHFNLALTQQSLGRHAEALQLFQEAIRFDPSRSEIRQKLGESYLALGRWEDARQAFEAILSLEPGHADALARVGLALAKLERHKEAAIALGNALLFGPTQPYANRSDTLSWSEINDQRLAEVQVRRLLGEELLLLGDNDGFDQQVLALEQLAHPAAGQAADALRRLRGNPDHTR